MPPAVEEVKQVALAVKDRSKAHNAPIFAAAIAFFAFLALIPALTGLITSYGIIADPDDIADQLGDVLESTPESTRTFLIDQMTTIADGAGGALGAGLAISTLLALFSASGAVANLIKALNIAYNYAENRKPWSLRARALSLTLGGVLVLSTLVFTMSVLPRILDEINAGTAVETLINIGRLPLLAVLLVVALSALYQLGPDHSGNGRDLTWRPFTVGAAVAMVLFGLLSVLFTFYTDNFSSYGETYGPLATIVVLLLWFQLSALAVIIGAEVDSERRDRHLPAGTEAA
ncbi:MAG: YihY/virulence factor BrkB family protein [Acidimicrobiales bacterium]|nr:YihY/virulence factor BrkB family protein [Acidimicrobiales bacterium]